MNDKIQKIFASNLLYYISPKDHSEDSLRSLLTNHPEVRFVSLVGVDFGGNDTDEKIPIETFLEDINGFLANGIQTDGSSVVLPGIATLNNGKVDLIPDIGAKWFVDHNYEFFYDNDRPVGTLRIPCFLRHNDEFIDSRSLLKKTSEYFESEILKCFDNKELCEHMGFTKDDIETITLTSATELEFWVRSPEKSNVKISDLSASEGMQEQYWKRTKSHVRTALERSLMLLSYYGLEPEMGHKEVGGVKAKLTSDGVTTDVLEQLEVDWKFDEALQAADNELLARTFIKEVFQAHGLDVSFKAKPISSVAGSGEHTHVGVSVKLKDGRRKNLFTAPNPEEDYMSILGWGGLMGILKNYEILNPFISSTNDAFERLKPGFEAPVCVVASIGDNLKSPSRNRTVLMGLIRDLDNPMATRFEVRSPNPHSNTYLVIATLYITMLHGIQYALGKTTKELEREFKKNVGDSAGYLETNRMYHSELDVFAAYTEEERNRLFGEPPTTVWENLENFAIYKEKLDVLIDSGIFTEDIIASYATGVKKRWLIEITNRIIPHTAKLFNKSLNPIREGIPYENTLDGKRWSEIKDMKIRLLKDSEDTTSLFTQLRNAIDEEDYKKVSDLQVECQQLIDKIKRSYTIYKRNMMEL